MTLQVLGVGLLALLVGVAFCFAGYRLALLLLPPWAFFAGFVMGSSGAQAVVGDPFLATILSWVVGFAAGFIAAVLSSFWYHPAVIVWTGSVGYFLGTGLMALLHPDPGLPSFVVGLVGAAATATLAALIGAPRALLIALAAIGGTTAAISGALLLAGRIPLESLSLGTAGAFIQDGAFWIVGWVILAALGTGVQWMTGRAAELDRAAFRFG